MLSHRLVSLEGQHIEPFIHVFLVLKVLLSFTILRGKVYMFLLTWGEEVARSHIILPLKSHTLLL